MLSWQAILRDPLALVPRPLSLLVTLPHKWAAVGGAQLHTIELIRHMGREVSVSVAFVDDSGETGWFRNVARNSLVRSWGKANCLNPSQHELCVDPLSAVLVLSPLVRFSAVLNLARQRTVARWTKRLMDISREVRADVVHTVNCGSYMLAKASMQAARATNAGFVVTPLLHPRNADEDEIIRVCRGADQVVVMTATEGVWLADRGVVPERIVQTGVGPLLESSRRGSSEEGPYILFVGRMQSYKGWDLLLEAAPLVWREFPELRFVFAGPPSAESVRASQRYADSRICFRGSVDEATKATLLENCQMLSLLSSQESFGGTIIEAWSCRRPVIVADIPTLRELVSQGQDGLVVARDVRQAAAAICQLCRDPGLRATMGEQGAAKASRLYAWPGLAQRTIQAYRVAMDASL